MTGFTKDLLGLDTMADFPVGCLCMFQSYNVSRLLQAVTIAVVAVFRVLGCRRRRGYNNFLQHQRRYRRVFFLGNYSSGWFRSCTVFCFESRRWFKGADTPLLAKFLEYKYERVLADCDEADEPVFRCYPMMGLKDINNFMRSIYSQPLWIQPNRRKRHRPDGPRLHASPQPGSQASPRLAETQI